MIAEPDGAFSGIEIVIEQIFNLHVIVDSPSVAYFTSGDARFDPR